MGPTPPNEDARQGRLERCYDGGLAEIHDPHCVRGKIGAKGGAFFNEDLENAL